MVGRNARVLLSQALRVSGGRRCTQHPPRQMLPLHAAPPPAPPLPGAAHTAHLHGLRSVRGGDTGARWSRRKRVWRRPAPGPPAVHIALWCISITVRLREGQGEAAHTPGRQVIQARRCLVARPHAALPSRRHRLTTPRPRASLDKYQVASVHASFEQNFTTPARPKLFSRRDQDSYTSHARAQVPARSGPDVPAHTGRARTRGGPGVPRAVLRVRPRDGPCRPARWAQCVRRTQAGSRRLQTRACQGDARDVACRGRASRCYRS